jgi:hypothetical protein
MALNQEDNLLIQSYFTVTFLTELKNNDFLNSDYYKNMEFGDKYLQNNLASVGIDNQGALLIFLYTMLVIPKQLLEKKFPEKFIEINSIVNKIKSKANSNYKDDYTDGILNIDYLRHIRNAVAHARVEFIPNESVTFKDEDKGKSCSITIPLISMGEFLTELQKIFITYVENLKKQI